MNKNKKVFTMFVSSAATYVLEFVKWGFSMAGGWIPATIAAVKTDVNSFYALITGAAIFICVLLGLLRILLAYIYTYTQILTAMLNQNIAIRRILLIGLFLLILAQNSHLFISFLCNQLQFFGKIIEKIVNHMMGK